MLKENISAVVTLNKGGTLELNDRDKRLLVPGLRPEDVIHGQALLSLLKRLNFEYLQKYLLANDEDAKKKHEWLITLIGTIENKRHGNMSSKTPKLVSLKSIKKFYESLIKEFEREMERPENKSIISKLVNENAHLEQIEAHIFNNYGLRLRPTISNEQDTPYILDVVKNKIKELIGNYKKNGGNIKDLNANNLAEYYVRIIPPATSMEKLISIIKEVLKE